MTDASNQVRYIASIAASQVAAPRWGLVASYNPADHTAKVLIQPEGTLTDELPISPMGGARYAPVSGQMAFLVPESQDSQALVISGFAFNDIAPPPQTKNAIGGSPTPLAPGEWEAIGPGGATFRLCADGTGYLNMPQGLNIEGNVNIKGTLTASNDVVAQNGSLNTQITNFNEHDHIVQTIGGPTLPPESQFLVEPQSQP